MQATIHDIERLFGTSDLNALEQIAKQWAAADRNPRGAGRKKKFTLDEVIAMKAMQQDGMTEAQLAERYRTSRQTISTNFRRLYDFTEHPTANSRIFYMHGDTLCTVIDVDHRNEKVYVKNLTEKPLLTAFGRKGEPTWQDYQLFLTERCFPQSRAHSRQILRDLGLDFFDPESIIQKTRGRIAGDRHWMFQVQNPKARVLHA